MSCHTCYYAFSAHYAVGGTVARAPQSLAGTGKRGYHRQLQQAETAVARGILLVNLGTPASCRRADVAAYLREFLMDGYVLDLPPLLRWLVVRMLILPFRPQRTAQAYARIWDAAGAGTGSPLLHNSRRCRERLAQSVDFPVALAMRYGNPGIAAAMAELTGAGADDILLIPMYPQHADSTRTTSIAAARAALPGGATLSVFPAFYDMLPYVEAQAAVIARNLPEHWDHLLFSYHGLPERHVRRADPSGAHCLASGNCCEEPSAAHATCYRHQAYRTAALLAQRLRIGPQRYSVSFQSRLGRAPWLKPYTDQQLRALPGRGVRDLVVACPAFTADNLETLEEIGIAGRDTFLAAGGSSLTLAPCMNAEPEWVVALKHFCTSAAAVAGIA